MDDSRQVSVRTQYNHVIGRKGEFQVYFIYRTDAVPKGRKNWTIICELVTGEVQDTPV